MNSQNESTEVPDSFREFFGSPAGNEEAAVSSIGREGPDMGYSFGPGYRERDKDLPLERLEATVNMQMERALTSLETEQAQRNFLDALGALAELHSRILVEDPGEVETFTADIRTHMQRLYSRLSVGASTDLVERQRNVGSRLQVT
jgi:hypothetical protein